MKNETTGKGELFQMHIDVKAKYIKIITAILLISMAIAVCQSDDSGKVFYIQYEKLVQDIIGMEYDSENNCYRVQERNAGFLLDVNNTKQTYRYLYMDLKLIDVQSRWKMVLYDKKQSLVAEEFITVLDGKNRIKLPEAAFSKIYLSVDADEDSVFGVKEIQFRKNSGVFQWEKFIKYTVVVFLVVSMCCLLAVGVRKHKYLTGLADEIKINIDLFAAVAGDMISGRIDGKRKHYLRMSIFLVLIADMLYLSTKGIYRIADSADLHRWIICGCIFAIVILCADRNQKRGMCKQKMTYAAVLFLLFACVADFQETRTFRYAAFCMLMFGGLLCRVWCNMKQSDLLVEEFKNAVKISYVFAVGYCVICRPAFAGICYSGLTADTVLWTGYLFVVLVAFLCDLERKKSGIWNGVGAVSVLYFIWMTQNIPCIAAILLVLVLYGVYWLVYIFKADGQKKRRMLIRTFMGILVGMVAVYLLRKLLYEISPLTGIQVIYKGEEAEYIDRSVKEIMISGNWKYAFYDQILVLKEYVRRFDLSGYRYLTKFKGVQVWPCNSFVMNTYRYGLVAGVMYGVLLVFVMVRALKEMLCQQNGFMICGLAAGGIIMGLFVPMEMPFLNMAWFGFYFAVCWIIASGERCEK